MKAVLWTISILVGVMFALGEAVNEIAGMF
jgi:hypothetical protein